MTYPELRDELWRHVLQHMDELGDRGFDWCAFHLNSFVNEWITKDMARAICRDLTNNGLAFYARGLFTEDGQVAGAGYAITDKGRAWMKEYFERGTP